MKISIDWLSDYISINKPPQEIADSLTMGIAEVEGIEKKEKFIKGVVIGEVLIKEKHPDADRLSVAQVDIGNKTLNIVCGANNLAVGQKVPVATIGTKLPDGLEIKKTKIRGVISEGMICSQSELKLAEKSDGIMVLPPNAKVGMELGKYLEWKEDNILEIDNKSLTHRSDLFGHIGIARELSAIMNKKIKLPTFNKFSAKKNKDSLSIIVEDKKLCPRYMAVVVDKVNIKESPKWMQIRLRNCGVRPINNIVDITNYVLLEYGQPLHAFDFDKLSGDKKNIIIRSARNGEKITTLDGKERELFKKDLIIADTKKVIAIAGVMGGVETEVDNHTKKIIIESANFDSNSVRKTSQRLALRTEAVTRFEKGLSPYFAKEGINRVIQLLIKYAGAEISSKLYDTLSSTLREKEITLDINQLNKYIGVEIKIQKVISILKSLDFKVSGTKKIKVTVPVYRMDINIPEDLIEEVARIYGYDNIKPIEISGMLEPVTSLNEIYWGNKVTEILAGLGLCEVMNYSFYGDKLLKKSLLTSKDHIELENPISKDLNYLRTSLLPGLFQSVKKNIENFDDIQLFEVGHVYFDKCECKAISGMIIGDNEKIFYRMKGIVETLLKKLNIDYKAESLCKNNSCEYFNMYADGRSLQYVSGKELLGTVSLADRRAIDNFDLKDKHLAFFNLSLEKISILASNRIEYQSIPKYPPATLDVALVLNGDIKVSEIEKEMLSVGSPLLRKIELFDIFTGKQIGSNKKSLAYHLEYRSDEKTLSENEVKEIHVKIINRLKNKFQARLRD